MILFLIVKNRSRLFYLIICGEINNYSFEARKTLILLLCLWTLYKYKLVFCLRLVKVVRFIVEKSAESPLLPNLNVFLCFFYQHVAKNTQYNDKTPK